VIFFNTLLALFNMIPIMPLDGAKVLKWNAGVYVLCVVAMGALLYFTRFVMPDL
jgi:Zn-dependent protease